MKKKKVLSLKNFCRLLWILYALMSVLVWLPKLDDLLTTNYEQISSYISLDDSWNITVNDTVYQNVSLEEMSFSTLGKGDIITMQRVLPEEWDITEGALRIRIRHTATRVFVDDELIYEYGHDRVTENKTVGSGLQYINFPEKYKGKTLTIRYELTEDRAFTKLDSVRIYAWENAYRMLLTENRFPLLMGCFLTVFGLVVCIMTVFALAVSRKYVKLLCISAFSFCMGLWTLCYYKILIVFSIPLHSITLIEYITLYMAPLPLIIYMYEDVKILGYKVFKVLYWLLLAVQTTTFAVTIALHTLDIVHMAATLQYMQILIMLSLLFFFVVILLNLILKKSTNKLFLVGMLIIIACITYDMAGYSVSRYFGNNAFNLKGMSSIGIMIFIIILFLTFYMEMTQKMMQENERNFLLKSAYTDELTKLHNRRYCMEHMSRIRDEKLSDYTVVCFDLNNLKKINDTYGHAKGDILIQSAADVLAESFLEHGIVARMGGDEFIAILNTADAGELAAIMEQFQANIRRKNQEVEDLNMSMAYGYASGMEIGEDIEKVYHVADNRMYENKKQMKEARRD